LQGTYFTRYARVICKRQTPQLILPQPERERKKLFNIDF
jgi:hypothetical protein